MKKTGVNHRTKKGEEAVKGLSQEIRDLGTVVKEYRMREGLSLSTVSSLTSIDEKSLAKLEKGIRTLPLSDLYCLCNTLNIPPSEFLEISHGLKK